MKKYNFEIRRVSKYGRHSLCIGLPKKYLKILNIQHFDNVIVELQSDGLFIKKIEKQKEDNKC